MQNVEHDVVDPFLAVEEQVARDYRRVLVIEDDSELSNILDRVLRVIDQRMEIQWATSVEEAQAKLVKQSKKDPDSPYDLIVADIFLEGSKTGLDLWRLCNQNFSDVPVVMTSALPMDKYYQALGQDAIAPPFLAKPFSIGECKQLFEAMFEYRDRYRKKH